MKRVKLTAGRIREFACKPDVTQCFLWDTEAPGLAVRATANGAKSYIYQSKLKGNTIRLTIGNVLSWHIETGDADQPGAREEARRLQTLIDQGIDPRLHKAERIAAGEAKREEMKRRAVTICEIWPEYIECRQGKWSERHLADHMNIAQLGGAARKRGKGKTEPGALAALMPLRLEEVTTEQVKAWLRDETAKRPTQARLAFGALRAFLNWCADTPAYVDMAHPEACAPRVSKQNLPKKGAKDDCLQREQLSAWFDAMRQIHNPVISAYLQALLLTGARREELAGLTWGNVDFKWRSLTIRDKVEGERTIPLTPYVASLLAALPRRTMVVDGKAVSNPWVFSSPTAASGRLQEPRIQHKKALATAGLPALSLHGLRRSFGTLAEWVECPAGVAAQIMGHKPSATAEKHYRRRPLDLLRLWHTKIEGWILEQAGIDQAKEGARPALKVAAAA